jgi:glutathione S-transferase
LFGELSIADLAIASMFRNAAFVRYSIDESRWPKTARFCREALALACFTKLQPFEAKMLRVPWPHHRAALAELGAPISAETFVTDAPRRGVMTI